MKHRVVAAVFLIAIGHLRAADNPPRFEVATLKQAFPAGDSYPITLGTVEGSRLILSNVTLSDCLKFAYGLVSDDQIAGPDWIRSKTVLFDIVAQVAAGTPREQLLLMTQSLLAERLGLVLHHEENEVHYLALVPAKGGPKMPAADMSQSRNNSGGRGHVTGNRVSMLLLAGLISRMEQVIVVDRTGLAGEFQVKLLWAPGSGGVTAAPEDTAARASLFAAVQEQLGLRLESRKGPLDVLVVDRAEKTPADN